MIDSHPQPLDDVTALDEPLRFARNVPGWSLNSYTHVVDVRLSSTPPFFALCSGQIVTSVAKLSRKRFRGSRLCTHCQVRVLGERIWRNEK